MPRRTVTLQDIAERASCSKNTASLALRDSARISSDTRRRIQALAEKMGYVPNYAARNLTTNRSGMIGVFASELYDAVRTELVNSLIAELHTAEYRPVLGLGQGHRGAWRTSAWMRTFQALKIEALVLVCEEITRAPTWAQDLPKILVANHPQRKGKFDCVALDRKDGGRLGSEHLLRQGHREILVACSPDSLFAKGCIKTITEAGRQPHTLEYFSYRPTDPAFTETLMDYLQKASPRPTAAIFGDSPAAARFMHDVQQHTKLRIPRDLAVVGYDYFPWADMLAVPLTTIDQPIAELAQMGVKLAKDRLADPATPPKQILLDHTMTVRASSRVTKK